MASEGELYFTSDLAGASLQSSGLATLDSLSVVPQNQSKWLLMGSTHCHSTDLSPLSGAPCDPEIPADFYFSVAGVTRGSVVRQHYASFWDYKESSSSFTTTLHGGETGIYSCSHRNTRLMAVGLEKATFIEQGSASDDILLGPQTRTSEILMQHVFHSDVHDALILTYGEVAPTSTNNQTTRGEVVVYLDSELNSSTVLASNTYNFIVGPNPFYSFSSSRVVQLTRGEHHLVWQTRKLSSNAERMRFRRVRALIIPLTNNTISVVQQNQDLPLSATDWDSSLGVSSAFLKQSWSPQESLGRKYFILSSVNAGPSEYVVNGRLTSRFCGLGLTPSSSCTAENDMYVYENEDLINMEVVSRRVNTGSDPAETSIHGVQLCMFHAGTSAGTTTAEMVTFFGESSRTQLGTPTNTQDYFKVRGRSQLMFQMRSASTALTDNTTYNTKDDYNKRILVELYGTTSVARHALTCDVVLFDGLTASDILTGYLEGRIDRDSIADLTVTGQQVLDALDAGDTGTATSLLKLNTGLPDGVTTSVETEYRTLSSIGSLYTSGLVSKVSIGETTPDVYYGVIGGDTASLSFNNANNSFFTNYEANGLFGSTIKIKQYDKDQNELRSLFVGKVTDIRVGNTVEITAINPNVDVLDIDIPKNRASNVRITDKPAAGTTQWEDDSLTSANDADALVPVFFANARRLPLVHVSKFFGTEGVVSPTGVTLDYLDAYSDYTAGGPNFSGASSVRTDTTYSPNTGVYRNWAAVTSLSEFDKYTELEPLRFDTHKLSGRQMPALRFSAEQVTTLLQHTGGTPRTTSTFTTLDSQYLYTTIGPDITTIVSIDGAVEGEDWYRIPESSGGNPKRIYWNQTLTNIPQKPIARAVGATLQRADYSVNADFSGRAQSTDLLSASSLTQEGVQPVAGLTIWFEGITLAVDEHYVSRSSNALRPNLIDIVDFGQKIAYNQGEWRFQKNLDDSSSYTNALVASTLTESEQPVYGETSSLKFTEMSLGTVGLEDGSIVPSTLWNYANQANGKQFRIVAFVQSVNDSARPETVVNGPIAGKLKLSTPQRGFLIGAATEAELSIPSGSATKDVFYAWVDGTTIYRPTNDGITLNDGALHSVELRVRRTPSVNDRVELIVDSQVQHTKTDIASYQLSSPSDFIVGGRGELLNSTPGTFKGYLRKLYMAEDSATPLAGMTYEADWDYLPDVTNVTFNYNHYFATDPIQQPDTVIAADLRQAGCNVQLPLITSSVGGGIGSTTFMWVKGPGSTGYAARINFSDPENAWTLGTAGLSETTYLGGIGTDGFISYNHVPEAFTPEQGGDFCLYAYFVFRGNPSSDSLIVAKHFSTTNISYCLGIKAGKAYAAIRSCNTVYPVTGITPIDNKVPVYAAAQLEGGVLKLYVNGVLDNQANAGFFKASDIDSGPLVIGSNNSVGSDTGWARFAGDISFVGAFSGSPRTGFHEMQIDAASRGVKGMCFDQDFLIGGVTTTKETLFHIPFTEGEGTTIKSRNLARNPALAIKRILSDDIIGAGEDVDSLNFDKGMTKLDNLGLKVDFVQAESRKMSDILRDLCVVRAISLKKGTAGTWTMTVDGETNSITKRFGSGDGQLENIVAASGISYKSVDEAIKKLILQYRYFADSSGNPVFHASVERYVLPYGTAEKVIDAPYIVDHQTADKVVDYLAKKLRTGNQVVEITVSQEGRDVSFGDIVSINIPRLGINGTFQVIGINSDGYSYSLSCQSYDSSIFTYDPGPLPKDENIYAGVTT